jgi:hypothetical protein
MFLIISHYVVTIQDKLSTSQEIVKRWYAPVEATS